VDDSFEELAVLREVDHGQVCQCHTHDDGGDQAGIVPERIAECSGAHHYGHDRLGGHRTAEAQLVQVVPSHEPGRQQQDDGGKPDSAGHDLTGRGEKDGHTEPDENVPPRIAPSGGARRAGSTRMYLVSGRLAHIRISMRPSRNVLNERGLLFRFFFPHPRQGDA
jgi:hypothetical protein